MAQKGESRIVLSQAEHVKNPFIRGFKKSSSTEECSGSRRSHSCGTSWSTPKGEDDADYIILTSLLHWKGDSASITSEELDRIFNDMFDGQKSDTWCSPNEAVVDLLLQQAEQALTAHEGVNFENKIVLSIATRVLAEKYMVAELNDLVSRARSGRTRPKRCTRSIRTVASVRRRPGRCLTAWCS